MNFRPIKAAPVAPLATPDSSDRISEPLVRTKLRSLGRPSRREHTTPVACLSCRARKSKTGSPQCTYDVKRDGRRTVLLRQTISYLQEENDRYKALLSQNHHALVTDDDALTARAINDLELNGFCANSAVHASPHVRQGSFLLPLSPFDQSDGETNIMWEDDVEMGPLTLSPDQTAMHDGPVMPSDLDLDNDLHPRLPMQRSLPMLQPLSDPLAHGVDELLDLDVDLALLSPLPLLESTQQHRMSSVETAASLRSEGKPNNRP
ncbi:MAG: hypothetical protein M1825_002914 [Sarcosagium campestre]|nr:MAG: hypothetical protein M1825_002914 [Sarcosagium campestre]